MNSGAGPRPGDAESASELPEDVRTPLRDLLLTLADNKRLLGVRYADWMLGAPSLETGIAASSMAQDEWGHARLTYALLAAFGDDAWRLEHAREATEYRSCELLDSSFGSWAEVIAAALLLDTAFTLQYAALAESRYAPARHRVQKLLEEESLHFDYATGWTRRLASTAARPLLRDALARFLPVSLRWLEGAEGTGAARLREAGITGEGSDALGERWTRCVAPVLEEVGLARELGTGADPSDPGRGPQSRWDGWDAARRRGAPGGPDADTLARVRGDRNRAALVD